MRMDIEQVKEWAALHAVGALEGEEAARFSRLLAESTEARRELASFGGAVEALANSLPSGAQPSSGLKQKILRAAERSKTRGDLEAQLRQLAPPTEGGFGFLRQAAASGWLPLRVPGAFVKLLS